MDSLHGSIQSNSLNALRGISIIWNSMTPLQMTGVSAAVNGLISSSFVVFFMLLQ